MPPILKENQTDDDEPDSRRPNTVFKQRKRPEPEGPIVKVFITEGGQELYLEDEHGTCINLQDRIPVKGPFNMFGLHEFAFDIMAAAPDLLGPEVGLKFFCARNALGYTIRRVSQAIRTGKYNQFCSNTNRMAQEVRQLDFEKTPPRVPPALP